MVAKKIVLTGGPGTGKTSILQELDQRGFQTISEAFKLLYAQALDRNRAHTFFDDQIALRYQLLEKQRELEAAAQKQSLIFLDRGAWDIIFFGYWYNIQIPADLYAQVKQIHYDLIFLINPLPDHLYQKTDFRFESVNDACKMHNFFKENYQKIGLPIVEVPFDTIKKRTAQILKSAPF